MKRKLVRMISAAIVLTLITFSFGACGNKNNSSSSNGAANASATLSTPPTITTIITVGTMPPEENIILEAIRKETGVDLKVALTTQADYKNKLAALTASRELPDIVPLADRRDLEEKVSNGVIIPLDQYVKSDGPNITKNKGQYLSKSCTVDGKLYAIPKYGTENVIPEIVAVRKDWLTNLNLKTPTTLDEFYQVMKAFTNDDPNKNGKKDTFGFGMGPNNLQSGIFEAFGISTKYPTYVDGKVIPELLHPNYLKAVEYFRKLYQEGLMEPDFATIPWMQCLEKLWKGNYGAFSFSPVGTTNNWLSRYTENPKPEFAYTILKGPDGISGVDIPIVDANNFASVNTTCKNPAAAIKVLDFLCSEKGNALSILGIEGKHYKNNEDGTISYLPPYDKDIALQRNEGGYAYRSIMDMLNGASLKTFNKVTSDAITYGMKNPLKNAYIYQKPEIEAEIGTTLNDIQAEAFATLVVTKGDYKKEYQDFVTKYKKSGGDKWVEQATKIYKTQEGIK